MTKLSTLLAFADDLPDPENLLRDQADREAARMLDRKAPPVQPHVPMFLCLDLRPERGYVPPDGANTTVADIVADLMTNPHRYPEATWTVHPTQEAADAYADEHRTIVVMPLVIEHNPLLGY